MAGKSFEEMVLAARADERVKYAKALTRERGPMPFGKTLTEDQQDELWMEMDPKYRDPQAALMLVAPKEQGGAGLTPLAASLVRYPRRKDLYEGAGQSIEDHMKYSRHRQERIAKKQAEQPAAMAPVSLATDHSQQFEASSAPPTNGYARTEMGG